MRVLADYHHHDLWESLELLLTDRLGWELYRPIGLDWYEADYWVHERKWHGDAVARQYLAPWHDDQAQGDCWLRVDHGHGRTQRMLTLAQARDLRPDIVISTLAHNHEGFARFAGEVGATFGLQLGNVRFGPIDMAEDRWDLAAFGLVSAVMPAAPPKPHVVYHQEFSLSDFAASLPPRHDPFRISSFVQCYPETDWAYAWMTEAAASAPELDWRVYGSYGTAPVDQYAAGNIDRCAGVAAAMRDSDVAWHAKRWSDGYGHVMHNWFAVGRPVFGFESYYRDQLAGPLWVDGVTSYDIERRSRDEVVALLRQLRDEPDRHRRMCEAAAARFREVVDFDAEEAAIRDLFARVLP